MGVSIGFGATECRLNLICMHMFASTPAVLAASWIRRKR
jgi:hypothetical protein